MSGDATIALGKKVLRARATLNEAKAFYGPDSHAAYRAKLALIEAQREAKESMS